MKLTNFTFFKNTPLINLQNTIHFESNQERDNFFLSGKHYESLSLENIPFNFIRDRSTIRIRQSDTLNYESMLGVNYCTFLSDFEPNTRYYAYVTSYKYHNDETIEIFLLIDTVMTFCQGDEPFQKMKNVSVERTHLTKQEKINFQWELRNNEDILKTYSKSYFHEEQFSFKDFYILMHSSADLASNFGTINNPNIVTSKGATIDNVSSPLDCYIVEQQYFKEFQEKLSEFAWIAQHIKKIILIPKLFIDTYTLEKVYTHTNFNFEHLYKIKDNTLSNDTILDLSFFSGDNKINKSITELFELLGLKYIDELPLLKGNYFGIEIYAWNGQSLIINTSKLNSGKGLKFKSEKVIGYENEIAIYIDNYDTERSHENSRIGTYLNNAIIFKDFDSVPVLIDSYQLGMSKGANVRKLAESKLISNRIGNVLDNNASLESRFFDVASLITNISPMNIFSKFTDQYEYYRQQKAEFEDLKQETPTITEQTNSNAFQIRNNNFGLTVKYTKPLDYEIDKIRKYHNLFGYEIKLDSIDTIHKMSICDYLVLKGNVNIDNIDISLLEMLKLQFENGIRFWHNNNTANPMTQDILLNECIS